jgi:uncharacterized Zn finger protein
MTAREKLTARFEAAKINGGAAAAEPRANGRYTVTGRAGDRYTCHVRSLDHIACDCKAGQHGKPCWHAAATFLRYIADQSVLRSSNEDQVAA